MRRVVQSEDSNGIVNTLVLEDGDMATLRLLKSKRSGTVKVTISSATAEDDIIYIKHKSREYEFKKEDLFG